MGQLLSSSLQSHWKQKKESSHLGVGATFTDIPTNSKEVEFQNMYIKLGQSQGPVLLNALGPVPH